MKEITMQSVTSGTRRVFGSALLMALAACHEAPAPTPPAPSVVVSLPVQREVTGRDSFTGRFEAADHVDVRARVGGYVEKVAFRDGSMVKKNDLLFVIDPRPFLAAVTQAEGHMAEAQAQQQRADLEMQRAGKLVATGAISAAIDDQRRQEQLSARAAIKSAAAALDRARLDLEFTRVRAPMAGRISRKLVSEGNLVAGGSADATLLTTIVSVDPIDVYFDIDEETYLRYGRQVASGTRASADNLGSEVLITLPGDSAPTRKGTLEFIDNRLDRSTGTLRGRARVANADHALNPGQFGRVQIVGEGAHQALLVQEAAISTDATRRVLNVVDANNVVSVRPVQLGQQYGALREITGGIKAGERIIVSGMQSAAAGAKVSARLAPMDDSAGAPKVALAAPAEHAK
jgi:RND family efflux transporter MFP subunit